MKKNRLYAKRYTLYAKKKGFTLMELMIGVGVLVVALAGLLAVYVGCFNLTESSRSLTTAMHDASKVMERIRITDFANITATDWTQWAADSNGGDCNSLPDEQVAVSFSGTDPLQVDIVVSWTDKQRARSTQISSLITQR